MNIIRISYRANLMRCVALMLLALSLVGCHDSYPYVVLNDGTRPIIPDSVLEEIYQRKTPLMMYVNEPEYFQITATRGTGAFEGPTVMPNYTNTVFYVYSFRDGEDQQSDDIGTVDLRWTSLAGEPAPYPLYPNFVQFPEWKDEEGAVCIADGPNYFAGWPCTLCSDATGFLEPKDTLQAYYSGIYQDVGFNFFVYSVDDFVATAENTERTEDKIIHHIKLDGGMDIMHGFAPKLDRELLDSKMKDGKLIITEADQKKILDIGNYSTFAAHRGIHPVANLKHDLTRLKFQAYPGDASANNVTIDSIIIEGKCMVHLTVAGRTTADMGITFGEEIDTLRLSERSPDGIVSTHGLRPEGYKVKEYNDTVAGMRIQDRRDSIRVGESILCVPDSAYKLTIFYSQVVGLDRNNPDSVRTRHLRTKYTLKASKDESKKDLYYDPETDTYKFLPGYIYTFNILVYGLEPIQVGTNIEDWNNGEDIPVDPDDMWFEPEWFEDVRTQE